MACYVLLSVFDLSFTAASGFRLVYLVVLAMLGLLTTYGLFMLKRWGLSLAVAVSILGITVGIATLYASVMFWGGVSAALTTSGDLTLLNTILIGYIALNIVALLYLCVKRKIFV